MIAYIKGTITHKGNTYIVVRANSIGYKVSAPLALIAKTKEETEIFLWTHLHIREDSHDLYGFEGKEELDFFEMLIGISGIGPKSALSIINLAPLKILREAIGLGDAQYLTKVSGIGRKTAEKIILELREKIGDKEASGSSVVHAANREVWEALQSLGYSSSQTREAIKKISSDLSTEQKIKEALKLLSR